MMPKLETREFPKTDSLKGGARWETWGANDSVPPVPGDSAKLVNTEGSCYAGGEVLDFKGERAAHEKDYPVLAAIWDNEDDAVYDRI